MVVTQQEFAFSKGSGLNPEAWFADGGMCDLHFQNLLLVTQKIGQKYLESFPAGAASRAHPSWALRVKPGVTHWRKEKPIPHPDSFPVGPGRAPPQTRHKGSLERGPICGAQDSKNSCRRKAETALGRKTLLRAGLIDIPTTWLPGPGQLTGKHREAHGARRPRPHGVIITCR